MNANADNEKFAQLSRFFDGEQLLDAELQKLLADEDVAEKWQEYSLQRAALRGECSDMSGMVGFASKVAEAIESEPLDMSRTISRHQDDIVRPSNAASEGKAEVTEISMFRNKMNHVWQGLGHVALAASVACVCVFGVSMYQSGNQTNDFNEQSFIGGDANISVSPVSNAADRTPIKMQLDDRAINQDEHAVNALRVDKEQLRLNEERKARELRTLDALMNDHELMQRMVIDTPQK